MSDADVKYLAVIDILDDILGESRVHTEYKHQIAYDCPVCSYEIAGLDKGDGKGNLEVNYAMGVYKCWACSQTHGTHGTIPKLIKSFGLPRHFKQYYLVKPEEVGKYKRNYKKVRLPKEFIPLRKVRRGISLLPEYKRAMNYLKKRNVTPEMIEKHNIGFCYEGDYENRIIFPSYNEFDEVNYFVGRSYLTRPYMKYKNPEAEKEVLIFNEHLIDWEKPVYLVEGVFDSIFLPNSIPLLGKKISDLLLDVLYENAIEIIIALDGDAWDDIENIYHKINCGRLMGKVKVVKLPKDRDIAEIKGNLSEFEIKKLD
jgi:hypothetical protein